ncbi:hypothetical protein BDP27DRAFT_1336859 [Rhodocollybia butyracea]|uniref:Uncharacterized protein n=1 Tax=Rhodocollybia butyracea TaxID=206335 RepID=A0A9P5U1C1_9AGAR|nr:hypothetical protein BDP27DRAFT_1336859 [Rhodocollybia butyracea]
MMCGTSGNTTDIRTRAMSEQPANIHRSNRSIVDLQPYLGTSTAAYMHTGPLSARELLDRLQSLYMNYVVGSEETENRRNVADICQIAEQVLSENEKSSEPTEEDGVAIRTFVPVIRRILTQTIECIHNNRPTPTGVNNSRAHWLAEELRNKLKVMQIIAMPYESCISSSGSLDDILVITSNISSVWFLLCDSVPVLGVLKPVPAALTKICQTVQTTIRSNKKLAEEILRIVRDDIRMVELRKDIQEYFSKLQGIVLRIIKGRRKSCSQYTFYCLRGFEQTHREIAGMQLRITALVSNWSSELEPPAPVTPSFPKPSVSAEAKAHTVVPDGDRPQRKNSFKQWVAVRRGKVSLLPYMGVYLSLIE